MSQLPVIQAIVETSSLRKHNCLAEKHSPIKRYTQNSTLSMWMVNVFPHLRASAHQPNWTFGCKQGYAETGYQQKYNSELANESSSTTGQGNSHTFEAASLEQLSRVRPHTTNTLRWYWSVVLVWYLVHNSCPTYCQRISTQLTTLFQMLQPLLLLLLLLFTVEKGQFLIAQTF